MNNLEIHHSDSHHAERPSDLNLELTFQHLWESLGASLHSPEAAQLTLIAEHSQFTRFNHSRGRQSGQVTKGHLTLTLMALGRTASATIPCTGSLVADRRSLAQALELLRQDLPSLPPDPFQVLPQGTARSREIYPGTLLPPSDSLGEILAPLAGLDGVGLYASGHSYRGYGDSAGQYHWFETDSFTLDYSLFTPENQAVKSTYTGRHWDSAAYRQNLATAIPLLESLTSPAKTLERGSYRTYLAPAAVAELVGMLSWGGIGEGALQQGNSALGALRRGDHTLSPRFSLQEDFALGACPRFNETGDLSPLSLPLITQGQLTQTLVSARTAQEYGIPSTGANGQERLRCPAIAPGTLPETDILAALDTGLYISNLHYLNWSDQPQGRVTGMTRYACFWVEQGRIVAPIHHLRFDDSLYHFWGNGLLALTTTTCLIPETSSYGYRALGSITTPGLLLSHLTYTL